MLGILFGILSGFFAATSDAFTKKIKIRDYYVLVWAKSFFALPVLLGSLFFLKVPEIQPAFWVALSFMMFLDVFALIMYVKAITLSPLSLTLPFLSFTPVFLIFTSWIMLGELPSAVGMIGILVVVLGAYMLHSDKIGKGLIAPFTAILHEKGSIIMLCLSALFSINANLGKIAILNSSVLFFFALHLAGTFLVVTILFFPRIKPHLRMIIREMNFFGMGISYGLMLLFNFFAFSLTIVPYAIAGKRTVSLWGVF